MYGMLDSSPRLLLALFVCLCSLVYDRPATAQTILLDRGYLDLSPASGPLVLGGDRGFGFAGHVSAHAGVFRPLECNADPLNCLPGAALDLRAYWVGLDLPGLATLDGITYPRVGSELAMLSVEFTGELTLPPAALSATVSAPVAVTGSFSHTTYDTFSGSGVATVYLVPDPVFPGSWRVTRVMYDLGPVLSDPWRPADIGDVGRAGSAVQVSDDAFIVSGAGADIWGTADAFSFVYRRLNRPSWIEARVMTETSTNGFAKAGVMMRASVDPDSPHVVLNMTPRGIIELMTRSRSGEETTFIAPALAPPEGTRLRLLRVGNQISGWYARSPGAWQQVGSVIVTLDGELLAGLAVTSHDRRVLNQAVFADVRVHDTVAPANLLDGGDFEAYAPPSLGPPGWISDHPFRQIAAKSETHQPRSGRQNGACWTPGYQDCGIYQEVIAPYTGTYALTVHASADRPGGLVGANVNFVLAATANVEVRPFGEYVAYRMTLAAVEGDIIRVWMYSPAAPGYVVIDDASMVTSETTATVSGGSWVISSSPPPLARFSVAGPDGSFEGRWLYTGTVVALSVCGYGRTCMPGTMVDLSSAFENLAPSTPPVTAAPGSAVYRGTPYSFLEYGGAVFLTSSPVVLPAPPGLEYPERVRVSAPFVTSGTLIGYEVLGLRDPRLTFELPFLGRGTVHLDLLSAPGPNGPTLSVWNVTYEFEQEAH